MRIIFMGTPDFSVGTLEALCEAGHDVCLAVTQPDKPKGTGQGDAAHSGEGSGAESTEFRFISRRRVREPECVEELTEISMRM